MKGVSTFTLVIGIYPTVICKQSNVYTFISHIRVFLNRQCALPYLSAVRVVKEVGGVIPQHPLAVVTRTCWLIHRQVGTVGRRVERQESAEPGVEVGKKGMVHDVGGHKEETVSELLLHKRLNCAILQVQQGVTLT
jgi:hypothetical protein